MREPLAIAVAQPVCESYAVAANASVHAEVVRAADARVVVFPELSLTGYELDAPAIAPDDARLAPIVQSCAQAGAIALVGAPVAGEGGAEHIAMLAVDGDRARHAYSKMHPGGAEPERFAPGPEPVVLDVDGRRFGLAICKDLGVADHVAATVALGVDALLAATLDHAGDATAQEERAVRVAAEYGVYVAMSSFAGGTGGGYTRAMGRSAVWRPGGALAARAGADTGAIVRTVLP
ncbi:carbon-nitrogen hydrolase family protein [Streptomonospora litoralis]|uniref:Carbon-nitrogen hydrolase n=1 Tax=Streptomonospora litoralis TaxID=2498135 RepID=A0A4P6PXF1_9ACTN|nr:carbon-nitrogen hydrolase family protein [Streptomonospora litoralis]QBI52878.1 Carbon-nitrogen hydrolase [Streptomonospora litoralis]